MEQTSPQELINRFYTAFQRLDAKSMNACYSNDIQFFDPMFELLQGDEVKSMWKMLCANAKDFSLNFGNIQDLGDNYYTCDWQASYLFSRTGRRVVNNAKAYMKIENGLITEHSDGFSMHKWLAQAFGTIGKLMGWNRFFQRRVKNDAKKSLAAYMGK